MFESFNKNSSGRDFVCSDIHGHFFLLEELLSQVSFDISKDRLFSLGDLIDRGDESDQVLEWLNKPWFYAIQGNHERMLINACESESDILWHQWFAWGGEWAEDLDREEVERYYDVLCKLPIAIELKTHDEQSIGLVHAELPNTCSWQQDVKDVLVGLDYRGLERKMRVSDMLWKKRQPYYTPEEVSAVKEVSDIDYVLHGHTIVDRYFAIQNRVFMDLGSYQSCQIGLINIDDISSVEFDRTNPAVF